MRFIAEYSLKENLRRKCYFIICLITCFLVSLVILVAKTVVSQGSLIFLMLGEKDAGEIDFYILSSVSKRNNSLNNIDDYHRDNAFFNFKKYEKIMKESKLDDEENDNYKNPIDTSTVRTYYDGYSLTDKLYLMLIDTDRERSIDRPSRYSTSA